MDLLTSLKSYLITRFFPPIPGARPPPPPPLPPNGHYTNTYFFQRRLCRRGVAVMSKLKPESQGTKHLGSRAFVFIEYFCDMLLNTVQHNNTTQGKECKDASLLSLRL